MKKKYLVRYIWASQRLTVRLATEDEILGRVKIDNNRTNGYIFEAMTPQDAKADWLARYPKLKVSKS